MQVELGGGTNPHPASSIIIDLTHPRMADPQDATRPVWTRKTPFGTEAIPADSVNRVYSSHFLEHIPHGQPLIAVMNEAWRILKPGGLFEARFPLVGYTDPASGQPMSNQIGWQPWADPTHVSYWWLPEAFMYFAEGPFKPCADYGISIWGPMGPYCEQLDPDMPGWSVYDGWEGHVVMEKKA